MSKPNLDVETDRSTLLALLRVSSTLWYEAASLLYRSIEISGDKMVKLLLAGTDNPLAYLARPKRDHSACCDKKHLNFFTLTLAKPLDPAEFLDQAELDTFTASKSLDQAEDNPHAPRSTPKAPDVSPRTRQALSFIRRLNLRDFDISHLQFMVAMAIPGVVLFPNVSKLHVHSIPNLARWDKDLFVDLHSCCPRTTLFGEIHLCAWQRHAVIMASNLVAKKYLTVNVHHEDTDVLPPSYGFSHFQEPWDKSSRVHWFIKQVNPHSELPEHISDLHIAGLRLRLPGARCLVGRRYGNSAPKIPTGDWDETETAKNQFRMDSGKHAACIVCNAKMEFGDRAFGCLFTTSL